MTEVTLHPECPFTHQTFELLEKFKNNSNEDFLFDPKYKFEGEESENIGTQSKPKKQDIDTMHTYCHAIRDDKGQQVVNYAAILYPGSYISYQDAQIEALPAYPGDEAELRKHLHRILSKALNEITTQAKPNI